MLLNSELRPREKSLALAYVMLLGGHLGIHRFYLKRIASAVIQLLLFVFAAISYTVFAIMLEFSETGSIVALILLIATGLPLFIWVIVDLFLLPGIVKTINAEAEQQILQQIEWLRQNPPAPRGTQGMQPQQPYQPPSY